MRKLISSSQNALSEIKKSAFPPKLQKIFTNDIQTDETAIDGEEEDGDQVSFTRALNNHHHSLFMKEVPPKHSSPGKNSK